MKSIINGLRYDTETSVKLGGASHGSGNDWHAWAAGLYRTPRAGRYFLAGEGGPLTKFGHGTLGQGGRWGGERIIPLTLEDAREWAEQYLSADAVEAAFASEIEDA